MGLELILILASQLQVILIITPVVDCLLLSAMPMANGAVDEESTNVFKTRLDKFWMNQEIIYDYHAEIQGTGS